ncbi:hypothetical protein EJB06_05105 [Massilia atriviolacea]|uniref:Uncharacterized protein n=2 Tax=Massilia atriviolacea TaxID=2495579 RepID=A0A430HSG4_9BURK|nr:hypothetical protein EJB06_05105 [Massilia atriviolacea]
MTVAYWVKDKELYSAQLNPYDVAGNPEKGPVELAVGSSEKYFTWALASGEPAPHPGAQVKSNLIEAILHAVKNDKASWLVDTGKIGSTKQGVISLSYICSTINQIQDASRYLWRINWICCREELSR